MKIVVIGSGTMGNGIAHSFAQNGYKTTLVDISPTALEKALKTIENNLERMVQKGKIVDAKKETTLQRLTTSSNLKMAVENADLVVEAATENLEVKLSIFKELDEFCSEKTILASNTSSISITKIASATQRPEKVIGMHFMNPVPMMKLVEVIKGYSTSDKTCNSIIELTKHLEKEPILVNDYPGFIANRILMPMINEAISALHEGVAGVNEIDGIMKLGMAHPMGPLQLADFIGLDVCLSILNVLHEGLGNPKYAPCPLLVKMVTAQKLGIKTQEGFYDWSNGTKELIVSQSFTNK